MQRIQSSDLRKRIAVASWLFPISAITLILLQPARPTQYLGYIPPQISAQVTVYELTILILSLSGIPMAIWCLTRKNPKLTPFGRKHASIGLLIGILLFLFLGLFCDLGIEPMLWAI